MNTSLVSELKCYLIDQSFPRPRSNIFSPMPRTAKVASIYRFIPSFSSLGFGMASRTSSDGEGLLLSVSLPIIPGLSLSCHVWLSSDSKMPLFKMWTMKFLPSWLKKEHSPWKDYSKSKRIRLSHLAGVSWIFVDCISKCPYSFCQKHIYLGRNFAQALALHQNEKFLHLHSKLANWDHLKSHIDSLLPSQDQWLVLLEGGWSPAPPRFSASPSRTHLWLSRESIHQLV